MPAGLRAGLVECSVFLVADALGATRVLNTPQVRPANIASRQHFVQDVQALGVDGGAEVVGEILQHLAGEFTPALCWLWYRSVRAEKNARPS